MFHVMTCGWLATSAFFLAGPGLSEIAHLPASQAGALLYLEPLLAMAVAAVVVVLGERVVVATVAGGAVILLGVWLVNRQPREDTARPAPPLPAEE